MMIIRQRDDIANSIKNKFSAHRFVRTLCRKRALRISADFHIPKLHLLASHNKYFHILLNCCWNWVKPCDSRKIIFFHRLRKHEAILHYLCMLSWANFFCFISLTLYILLMCENAQTIRHAISVCLFDA